MKVFISWSGDLSKNLAEIFRQWIPGVVQAARPYYSPDDITKGTRWNSEISKELDESKVGIICLTKDNLESPWIMFEAGALSKNIDKSKVCPILFSIEPTDIQGPLIQFQAAKFSKAEIKRVVKMINSELAESGLANEVLDSVFEMWWPQLESKVEAELAKDSSKKAKNLRSERDMLEEILKLSRELTINKNKLREPDLIFSPRLIEEMVMTVSRFSDDLIEFGHPALFDSFERLVRVLDEIIERADLPISMKKEFRFMTRDRMQKRLSDRGMMLGKRIIFEEDKK